MNIVVFSHSRSIHVKNRFRLLASLGYSGRLIWPNSIVAKHIRKAQQVMSIWKADADVFHAHYAYSFSTIHAFLAGKFPLLISTMGGDILLEEQWDPNHIERKIVKLLLVHADGVTAKSQHNREVISKLGRPTEATVLLNWGVNLQAFQPQNNLPVLKELQQRDNIILHPRGLDPVYNTELMLKALKIVIDKGIDATLFITKARHSPLTRATEEMIKSLGISDHVILGGEFSESEMNALYNKSKTVVSIAKSDGIPMTVIEALATGTSVVLGKLPHFKHEFDDNVITWTELKAEDVADAIVANLSDNTQDKQVYRRQFVSEHFDSEEQKSIYNNELERLKKVPKKNRSLTRLWLFFLLVSNFILKFLTNMVGRKPMHWVHIKKSRDL